MEKGLPIASSYAPAGVFVITTQVGIQGEVA